LRPLLSLLVSLDRMGVGPCTMQGRDRESWRTCATQILVFLLSGDETGRSPTVIARAVTTDRAHGGTRSPTVTNDCGAVAQRDEGDARCRAAAWVNHRVYSPRAAAADRGTGCAHQYRTKRHRHAPTPLPRRQCHPTLGGIPGVGRRPIPSRDAAE